MNTRRFTIVLFLFALGAVACEHADPIETEGNGFEPTLSSIQSNIFDRSCAVPNCHVGNNPPRNLDLSAGNSYNHLVNVKSEEQPALARVEPGDPDASYMFMKITGAAGIIGEQMPRGRDPLSAEQIAAIREWILAGAENN